jgi:hypothetical protein
MRMYYLIIVQIVCGFFSAFVAGRKGRNQVAWWFIGALVPVAGVVLSYLVSDIDAAEPLPQAGFPSKQASRRPERPKRCCGSYIPDCLGCPYFRRQLFSSERADGLRGHCEYFDKDLRDRRVEGGSEAVVEEKQRTS